MHWVKKLIALAGDFLAPQSARIKGLLNLPPELMYSLLPRSPVRLRDIYVLFDYQNAAVKLIVKALKYKNNAALRRRLAGYLHQELVELASDLALFDGVAPLIVPMPMSRREKRERGFNQCEELCREIQKIGDNMEISYDLLQKIRETGRQTKMSRAERETNVKDSMRAFLKDEAAMKTQHPERSLKTVIVLDDVYTTGASFNEARRALLSSGVRHVVGLFIAH